MQVRTNAWILSRQWRSLHTRTVEVPGSAVNEEITAPNRRRGPAYAVLTLAFLMAFDSRDLRRAALFGWISLLAPALSNLRAVSWNVA